MSPYVGAIPAAGAIFTFRDVREARWIDLGPDLGVTDPARAQRFIDRMKGVHPGVHHAGPAWAAVAAVAVVAVYVLSVVAHELGHAAAVRRVGLQPDTIELTTTGGVVTFRDADELTAGKLAAIAGAGPLVTAAVTGVSLAALLVLGWPLSASPDAHSAVGIVAQEVLQMTFVLNAVCLVINLLPFRPLDGGHLLAAGRLRLRRSGY